MTSPSPQEVSAQLRDARDAVLDSQARVGALLEALEAVLIRSERDGASWPWEELAVRFVQCPRIEVACAGPGAIDAVWLGRQLKLGQVESHVFFGQVLAEIDAALAVFDA